MSTQMRDEDDISKNMSTQMGDENDVLENMSTQMGDEDDISENMSTQMGDEDDISENMSTQMGDEDDILETMSMDHEFAEGTGPKSFTFDELNEATNNFSEEGKIGEGGFGGVYKGMLAHSTKEIAVKRVAKKSKQSVQEYKSEVLIISQLRHKNLVKLVGWCHEKRELLLVYEFMPNGSLDFHLFGRRDPLSWGIRYKVALGLASALLYLHEEWEQCVLHRDIKTSNVMLDSEFNAKLGDFGLARFVDRELRSQASVLGGTIGYLAPECLTSTGKYSKESDVYSFGVIALEIACGRMAIKSKEHPSKVSLVSWIQNLHGEDKLLDAADAKLNMEFQEDQIKCLMIVGLRCCHPNPTHRPSIRQAINDLINFQATVDMKDSFKSYLRRHLFRRRKMHIQTGDEEDKLENMSMEHKFARGTVSISFSFAELKRATRKFSEKGKLGGGVYKGLLTRSSQEIVVKRIPEKLMPLCKKNISDVMIISKLNHTNLVKLIGCCHQNYDLLLVYEYVPNGSLDSHLFGRKDPLSWAIRYKVALGVASALLYLHEEWEQCVLHRDIKSSNVMLDSEFNAKLGDFGLTSIWVLRDVWPARPNDYRAPECLLAGAWPSKESDVYSFGVVALEIACGRKLNILEYEHPHKRNLINWVWALYGEGTLLDAADMRN